MLSYLDSEPGAVAQAGPELSILLRPCPESWGPRHTPPPSLPNPNTLKKIDISFFTLSEQGMCVTARVEVRGVSSCLVCGSRGLAVRSCTSKPSCPRSLKSASNSRRADSGEGKRAASGEGCRGDCGCSPPPLHREMDRQPGVRGGGSGWGRQVPSLSPGVSAPGQNFKHWPLTRALGFCEPSGATREEVGACPLSCLGDITLHRKGHGGWGFAECL